jgi:predicted phosphodiesterase
MPIATLYDVHGNIRALEAVLQELPDDATIVVGGDVAAGPFPQESVDRLRALGDRVRWLRGNADRELVEGEEGLAPPELIAWVRSKLDAGTIEWLGRLPPTLVLERVLYCHATPRNDVDIFTERTPEERIAFLFEDVSTDVIVCGHTHMQFDRTIAGKRVVNSGSVGMAYDEPRGAYWTLDLEPRHTPYGLELGDYPFEWPSLSRDEAIALFESRAV